jgi:uncharacterized heparinase superfamily protein
MQTSQERRAGSLSRRQIGLAVRALERAGRGAMARMRRTRLPRWRTRGGRAEELLLAPPDLRVLDHSFAAELAAGSIGLGGVVAHLGGQSPFAIAPPSAQWARELHGFGWLRHLSHARAAEAEAAARALLRDWLARRRHHPKDAWTPEVTARRVLSWLAHAGVLLDGAAPRAYAAFMRHLSDQVDALARSWEEAPDGYPRLLALIALVQADLCIADRDAELARSERLLAAELKRQILADGGHLSRNAAVLVELLLDLLPLRQCFAVRKKEPDAALSGGVARIAPMLAHLRLGDGMLARFNGVGAAAGDGLAGVLAYDGGPALAIADALPSGYVRLARGSTIVVVDAGAPPPLELAGAACAGCLAFELSTGSEALLVNAGAPGPAHGALRALARATASHNTLTLGEQSSARLVRDAVLERQLGAPPLRHPDHVAREVRERDGGLVLEASHDGYVARFGLVHARTLQLDAGGTRLEGIDRLLAPKGVLRFSRDVPLAIHFHLHPDAEARIGEAPGTAELLLPSGAQWRLTVSGAALSIEPDTHFADVAGPCPADQIVLRAGCGGAMEVFWTLERIAEGRPLDRAARQRARSSLAERLAQARDGFEFASAGFDASEPAAD